MNTCAEGSVYRYSRLLPDRAMQLSAHPRNGNNFQGDEKWQVAREILDNYHCLINRLGVQKFKLTWRD